MTLVKIESAKGKNRPAVYLVKDGSTIVGQIQKYRNTKDEIYPWQAFIGYSLRGLFIGSYGGKQAAIQAIADRRDATGGKIPAGIDFDVP